MMYILATNYNSFGEAFVVGCLSFILASLVIKGVSSLCSSKNTKATSTLQETACSKQIKNTLSGNHINDILDELKDKCNPRNFMDPYDFDKVNKANSIYQQILKCNPKDIDQIKNLRQLADSELSIKLSSYSLFVK